MTDIMETPAEMKPETVEIRMYRFANPLSKG